MTNKKANVLMIIGAFVLIGLIGGFAIAFFNYTRTGGPNNVTTGRIVFNSSQYETIHLTNVFPIASSEAASLTDNAISVTVSGDTTYVDGEEFLISLVEVNNVVNGKEIPINYTATYEAATGKTIGASSNNYWSARESKDASIYLLNSEGIVEEDAQVLVGYIDNGATGIEGILTIKAYVDASRIAVSDTLEYGPIVATGYDNGTTSNWVDGRTVLTTEEWNNLQGNSSLSFKIKAESNEGIWVSGGPTPETCFTTNVLSEQDHTVEITGYNGGATYVVNPNPTQQQVSQCATYMGDAWGNDEGDLDEGESWETFCDGTGTYWEDTFQDYLNYGWLDDEMYPYFESIGIIIKEVNATCGVNVEIPRTINGYTVVKIADGDDEYSAFGNKQISKVVIPNTVTTIGDSAFYTNKLKNLIIPNSVTSIGEYAFNSNELTNVIIPNSVTSIGNNAFSVNKLTNVTIPNSLTRINNAVFLGNQLTSINIPNNITSIGSNAFASNKLTTVSIPDSVTSIENFAFSGNQLIRVSIGNGISSIGRDAFDKANQSNLNLSTIIIDKPCSNIKNNLKAESINYYPWLTMNSPYTASGVTIIGANNEVCDAF